MYSKQLAPAAIALTLGLNPVSALYHGERENVSGLNVRWQEVATGIFTGVPEEEWDDSHHKRSLVELDLDELVQKRYDEGRTILGPDGELISKYSDSAPSVYTRDLELESRNLWHTCQAVGRCLKSGAQITILTGWNAWLAAAEYARDNNAAADLWDFLNNRPFVANVAGGAVAGWIIYGSTPSAPDEIKKLKEELKKCSTKEDASDLISSVVHEVLRQQSDASEVVADLNGGDLMTFAAKTGNEGETPTGTCPDGVGS